MAVVLKVRKNPSSAWQTNFSLGAWTVISSSGQRIQMGPHNTKVRSADGTQWLDVK
jgi:hypothetical protein